MAVTLAKQSLPDEQEKQSLLPPPHPWRVAGATAIGTSHQKAGLPCQDALGYRQLPGGGLVIALADGAGSAAHSECGAQTAIAAALASLHRALETWTPSTREDWEALVFTTFAEARFALVDLATSSGERLRAYATTLTCLAVTGDWLAAGSLGDGVLVAGDKPDDLAVLTQPQRGEYANETLFLTQESALDEVQVFAMQEPFSALAVMSDGLLRLALNLPARTPHKPFFQPLFSFISAMEDPVEATRHLETFLGSERVCARTDDDKALVLAIRR